MSANVRGLFLAASLALILVPSNLPAAALPLLRAEWSASGAELGWVVGAYQLGYAIAVVIVLPLTDRVAVGRVVVVSTLLTALGNLAFPLARDPLAAAAIRFATGAALAGVYMPGVRIVAATARENRRGFAVGAYVAAFYLGASLSLYATGALLGALDWRGAALALAGAALLAVPVVALGLRGVRLFAGGSARLDLRVMRDPPLRGTILAYAGHSSELFVVRAWLASFLAAALVAEGRELSEATAVGGQWSALLLALGVPGVFVGGWISDRSGRRRAAIVAALASGLIGMLYGQLLGAPWPLLLAVGALYGGIIGADSAVYSVRVTELAPPERIGSAQAVQSFVGFGAGALGPVVAGAALDLGFGYGGVFVVAGVTSLLAAAMLAGERRSTIRA